MRDFVPVSPCGTLFINIVGSLMVGFFVIWTTGRVVVDPRWRLMVVVGLCGSFTTFSSYALEAMSFFGQVPHAGRYPRQQPALPGGALAGMAVARALK